jgi:hypothetical protein
MRELTTNEIDRVSGGVSFDESTIGFGIGLFSLGILIAATGGIAAAPIVFGAITSSAVIVGGTAVGLAATGGVVAGSGITLGASSAGSGSGGGLEEKDS